MVGRKRQNQPEIDICKRCHNEITDRRRLGFGKMWYHKGCQRDIRNEYLRKKYKERHPKKPWKQDVVIKRLKKSPATEKELLRISKFKNTSTLKTILARLRHRGYNIQAIHFMPSHYVLVNPK